jgi:hypothetical protein
VLNRAKKKERGPCSQQLDPQSFARAALGESGARYGSYHRDCDGRSVKIASDVQRSRPRLVLPETDLGRRTPIGAGRSRPPRRFTTPAGGMAH